MKTLSIAVPCYNSEEYMRKCVDSLLVCGNDIEIILVNDGSSDGTAEIIDEYAERYPDVVKAVHQVNGGHGEAVNSGLRESSGLYFKVVDSDDWLDEAAMIEVMAYLRSQLDADAPTDLVMANYVYDKVFEGKATTMRYKGMFPVGERFGWSDVGHIPPTKYILMHSVIYRTQLLKDMGLKLPDHCFYVDNIFVYEPLPYVKSIYYLDVSMYHYFIGREGQSVDETTMMNRMDQQLRVTRTMIDATDLDSVDSPQLRKYMRNYLAMMMCICSVFLRMKNTPESEEKLEGIWSYLESSDVDLYKKIRHNVINLGTNIPTEVGRRIGLGGYRLSQKIFKFN